MKKKKYQVFTQPVDIYRHDILVCVGATYDQARGTISKRDKKFRDFLEEYKFCFDKILSGKQLGYTLYEKETGHMVLIIKKYENNWVYWETLIHELNHIVYDLAVMKSFTDETEAQAYLQEFLFHEIRRKIQLSK